MTALLAFALAVARPLPDPRDPREGERATQCILLYRLQRPDVPTDAAACEDAGYGLEFMRERDGELRALEQRHADELAHAREVGKARAEAKKARPRLEVPCRELALATGPGPDGGAELCALAGLTPTVIAGELGRERVAAAAKEQTRAAGGLRVLLPVGLIAALGVGLGWLAKRRRD